MTESHNMSDQILKSALHYGEMGYRVFPTHGKDPVFGFQWKNWATSDLECIREIFSRYPEANIAIVVPEGCTVIDIDIKIGVDGLAALREYAPAGWDPINNPDGPTARTGSEGLHVWYTCPEALRENGNKSGRLPKGVDVRGGGSGYVVVAPSLHPETGKAYQWLVDLPGDGGEFPPLPEWLEALLLAEKTDPRPTPPSGQGSFYCGDRSNSMLQLACDRVRRAEKGTRNNELNVAAYTVAGAIAANGGDLKAARDALVEAAREVGLDEREIRRTLDSAFNAGTLAPLPSRESERPLQNPKDRRKVPDERPVIKMGVDLHRVVDDAVDILPRTDLFQRNGALSHVVEIEREVDEGRMGLLVIRRVKAPTLKERLTRAAKWVTLRPAKDKEKGKTTWTEVPSTPSRDVIEAALARGEYPGTPVIIGVSESPFMRADGSICAVAGYDSQTGIYYRPRIQFPTIPDAPTEADARDAYRQLEEVFNDFPFDPSNPDVYKAVLISGVLTVLARPMFVNTPALTIEASTRGSGKTLATDVISMIATGHPASKLSWPGGREWSVELDKVLASVAVDASPMICFDNIKVGAKVGGPALDKVLTCGGRTKFRTLGKTEAPELPWNTIVFMNGNNIVAGVQDETRRRVLPCRMVPDCEKPEDRNGFRHPALLDWTKQERARLVAAGLTIVRYCIVAKSPTFVEPWGSFEQWSRVIPNAILLAGGPNIMEARQLMEDVADEEDVALDNLLDQLHSRFPDGATAQEIVREAGPADERTARTELRIALDAALPGACTTRSLGKFLSGRKDRIFGEFQLMAGGKIKRAVVWKVHRIQGNVTDFPSTAPEEEKLCPGGF